MKSFSITDIGQKREINQDFIYCNQNSVGALPNLYIVADGMGGHNAGDYASRFTVETFTNLIVNSIAKTPIGMIETAINKTNDLLIAKAKEHSDLQGMGTTFVM
ncbi:MAG: serine/threonine-protein phosphatase, partial [Lachnospiraceae bacterium]|nr:serine/threonine-protein phosphatase [Lachnospiraceae bacterium]